MSKSTYAIGGRGMRTSVYEGRGRSNFSFFGAYVLTELPPPHSDGTFLTSWGKFELRKHSIGFVGSLNAVIRLSVMRDVCASLDLACSLLQFG